MKKRRLTKVQRDWCQLYQDETGFEPLIGDFHAGRMSFYDAAHHAAEWFEHHTSDALLSITADIPGWEEHMDVEDAKQTATTPDRRKDP